MKGLIIKDFQLLFSNKRILYIVFAIALFSAMMGDGITLTYISSFVAVMLQVSALATISYDNYQHGNTFLMTLPLRRKDCDRKIYFLQHYCICWNNFFFNPGFIS